MKAVMKAQLGQSLHLTPQLLQSIRLLQLTGLELELEIRRALETNPLLEREDEAPEAEAAGDAATASHEVAAFDELPDHLAWAASGSQGFDPSELDDRLGALPAGESSDPALRALERARFDLDDAALAVAAFWLEHTGDHGWLDGDRAALAAEAARRFAISPADAEAVRQALLHGDPAGLCAVDLAECLGAQLDELPHDAFGLAVARRILDGGLERLAADDAAGLARHCACTPDALPPAVALLRSLDPKPGLKLLRDEDPVVLPDVVTWFADGAWRVALNPVTAPKLRVAPDLEAMLAASGETEATRAMRELLGEARWLARGVAQRGDTLLRTARAIIARQAAFLERGDEGMAPLTLKEIATEIGMHESTISRITTGKYLQTPRGMVELKRFFAVRLEGAEVSGTAVKAMVKRLIDAEPSHAPLADDTIAGLLARQGIQVARRTVAKYREQLEIPPARLRGASTRRQAAPSGLLRAG